jgi:hypothetical protein
MTDIIESDPSMASAAEPRPERGPWALFAGLIALALAARVGATWHDFSSNEFSSGRVAIILQSLSGYGEIALLAQIGCAAVARGGTRRLAAAICEVTALAVAAGAVAGEFVGSDSFGRGGWSLRVSYVMSLVIAVAIGGMAIRLTHDR